MAGYEPDGQSQEHLYLTECNSDSLPTEHSVLLEGSNACVEHTTENLVLFNDDQNPTQLRSDLTDCNADSLSTPQSVSLEACNAGVEQSAEDVVVAVDSQNAGLSRSDLTQCYTDSLSTQHSVSLDPCYYDVEHTLERYVESDRQVSDSPFIVVDDVNHKRSQSNSGDGFESDMKTERSGIEEDQRHNTPLLVEEGNERRCFTRLEPAEACASVRETNQSVLVEVNVSENQSHDKNISVEVQTPIASFFVKVSDRDCQRGKEIIPAETGDLDNQMPPKNVSKSLQDAELSVKKVCSKAEPIESKELPDSGFVDVEHSMVSESNSIDLIRHLGLLEYYPEKISITDVMQVSVTEMDETNSANLPWIILQQLIMLDRHGITKCSKNDSSQGGNDEIDSSIDLSALSARDDELNPADVFLATFLSCDLNLRQILIEKMNQCRLAFPFLFPDEKKKLNLSLWALRNTKLAWRNASQEAIEASSVDHPLKVVSCLRLGRPEISKSKILNNIIKDQGDCTFLNEGSPNGDIPRVFADGSVEGAFFLPTTRKAHSFEDVTLLLNLRGNGLQHSKQVNILGKMSSVVLVYVDVLDLELDDVWSKMKIIKQLCNKVIMVLSSCTNNLTKEKVETILNDFKAKVGSTLTMVFAFTIDERRNGKRNEDKLKIDIKEKVKRCLSGEKCIVLQDQQQLMDDYGVSLDEMTQYCQDGRTHAENVLSCLRGKNRNTCKSELLPLQERYWKEWCKLLKRKRRSGQQTIEAVGQIEKQMLGLRKEQARHCNDLSPLTQAFINGLEETIDSPSIHFYMQWLKMSFDDFSRKELHPMLQEYRILLTTLTVAKDKGQGDKETLYEDLKTLEQKIDNANLGIEHLLREMGQIYEATEGSDDEDQSGRFCHLPILAAKLLLKGHPLEIMDGDASGLPLNWLKAIFKVLEKEIDDPKLLSLSVLGVQSSGKSTLLNTMFGLQLPVSAGRCTTGVYMQLVKVRDGSNLPFKYLAVFDTEGLRAPERSESNYDHDNELATFVIGLGNLTLMNIKGENLSESRDILQIVTHAFLRMKMVNESFQRDRSCLFVHQNVPAFDAKEKNLIGSQRFEEALDKKTQEAAEMENIADINSFKQVIKFDNKKHIWYFPDLWYGVPPMASVNTDYHEKIMDLRTYILESQAIDTPYLFSLQEMIVIINDMWNGILADDFVFGFRNSLVSRAYIQLADKYTMMKCDLEMHYLQWKETSTHRVEACKTQDSLQLVCGDIRKEAANIINGKTDEVMSALKTFVDSHIQKELMHSWEKDRSSSLEFVAELLCLQAQKDLQQLEAKQKVNMWRININVNHKEDILEKAVKLAKDFKGTNEKIYEKFDEMWEKWMRKIPKDDQIISIEQSLKDLLYEHYHDHSVFLTPQLSKTPLDKPQKTDSLLGSITVDDISNADISYTLLKRLATSEPYVYMMKIRAVSILNTIFQQVDTHLRQVSKGCSGFQTQDAQDVLKLVDTDLKVFNKNPRKPFKFPKRFEIYIAVHVFRYALRVFSVVQDSYSKNHSITAQLEEYKKDAWNMFEALVDEKADIAGTAVAMVCAQLETLLKRRLQQKLQTATIKEVVQSFLTKENLIKKVLLDLSEKNSIEKYEAYIRDSKSFVSQWLANYTDKTCSGGGESSWYMKTAKSLLNDLITNIQQSVKQSFQMSHKDIGSWIAVFSEELLQINHSMTFSCTRLPYIDDHEVQDVKIMQKHFKKHLERIKMKVLDDYRWVKCESIRWADKAPYEQILNSLWGCEAVCPFCMEPCKKSDPNHGSKRDCHECVQHRPQGVRLAHSLDTERPLVENCNFNVQSTRTFMCHNIPHKCTVEATEKEEATHHFKHYKKFMPEWYIKPSPDMESSNYWKWYLCKYKTQIVRQTKLKEPDIPNSWYSITIEQALESLHGKHQPKKDSFLEKVIKVLLCHTEVED